MNAVKTDNEPTQLLCGRRVPAKDYEVLKRLVNVFASETRPRTLRMETAYDLLSQ